MSGKACFGNRGLVAFIRNHAIPFKRWMISNIREAQNQFACVSETLQRPRAFSAQEIASDARIAPVNR